MKYLLYLLGYGWAVIGLGNMMLSNVWRDSGENAVLLVMSLIFINMFFFILPGLLVGGLGTRMNNNQKGNDGE